MKINKLYYIEGAKKAKGLTVIIDVFRAFTVECYLYKGGVKQIFAVGSVDQALELGKKDPEALLIGERNGFTLDGFHYGNSPHHVSHAVDLQDKIIIHTTSAGTQGIVHATGATEIITGSFVNAKAIAVYIKSKDPEVVSLVAMGNNGKTRAIEDNLCADYIESLLKEENPEDEQVTLEKRVRNDGGERFFHPDHQDTQPKQDFHMSLNPNQFDFVIKANRVEDDIYLMDSIKVDL